MMSKMKKIVKSRWPRAYAVNYAARSGGNDWHIGDGYGGYESDLGSGDTESAAWEAAYNSEHERRPFN